MLVALWNKHVVLEINTKSQVETKENIMDNLTPGKAIRKFCVNCAGNSLMVKNCGGDKLLNKDEGNNGVCYFYKFRMGKGRPSVKLIRKMCIECTGKSYNIIANCPSTDCPLYKYRFGKNPNYQKTEG